MLKIALYLVLTILFTSCAVKPRIPAKEKLTSIKLLAANSEYRDDLFDEESNQLIYQYLWSKNHLTDQKEQACKNLKEVVEEKVPHFTELALNEFLNVCHVDSDELIGYQELIPTLPDYAHYPLWEKLYHKAKIAKNTHVQAESLFYLTDHKRSYLERIKTIQKAIELNSQEKYLKKLYSFSPSENPKEQDRITPSLARDYQRKRKFDEARSVYRKLIAASKSPADQYRYFKKIRLSYKLQSNRPMRLAIAQEMYKFFNELHAATQNTETLKYRFNATLLLIRSYWTENQNKQAIKIMGKALKGPYTKEQLALFYFYKGKIVLEEKAHALSLVQFKRAFALTHNHELKKDLIWIIGWTHFIQNHLTFAIHWFQKGLDTNSFYEKMKLNFWIGKAHKKMRRWHKANQKFRDVYNSDPFHYYGIIAAKELRRPFNPVTREVYFNKQAEDSTLEWLSSLEAQDFMKEYLKKVLPTLKGEENIRSYLPWFYQADWAEGQIWAFYRFDASVRARELNRLGISYAFPLAYVNEYRKFARKNRIPLSLPLSISRQESAFNPKARSWADAFGLMQVLPSVAEKWAPIASVEYNDPTDLMIPENNIAIGTVILKDLGTRFKGEFIPTIASYNAREQAVRHWKKTRFREDPIEFIEMVPYEETRTYLKTVLRNMIIYKQLLKKKMFYFPNKIFYQIF